MANASNALRATRKPTASKVLPAAIVETLAAKPIAIADHAAALRAAMGELMTASAEATNKVQRLADVIRAASKAGKPKEFIAENCQLGALMNRCAMDLATATAELGKPKKERTELANKALGTEKTQRCRAFGRIAIEDAGGKVSHGGKREPKAGKADKPGKSEPVSFMGNISVPAPLNAPDFHCQLVKLRTLIKRAIDQAETLDGADADLKAAQQALALLPTK